VRFLRTTYERLARRLVEGDGGIVAWMSDQGPVCYQAPLVAARSTETRRGAGLLDDLLGSGLGWCWASGRLHPPGAADNPDLPALRPVTALIRVNGPQLLSDLQEARWFTLFGVEPDALATVLNPAGYQTAITAFAEEAGPLQVAIYQEGDQPAELVFVPHAPAAPVRRLLETWGITPATIRATHRLASSREGFIETFAPYE
jgi:hypothetical protein